MILSLVMAALLQDANPDARTLSSPAALRDYAHALAKAPTTAAGAIRFRVEYTPLPDTRTDIAALQTPIGWSYDARRGVLTLDVSLGAMTPQNYREFDAQGLNSAPPLRTVFFSTRATRDEILHIVDDQRGGADAARGWRVVTESYGLAFPADAQAHGVSGGDLPDGFSAPLTISMPVPQAAVSRVVAGLRLRMEGRLRTIQGRSVLCGGDRGDGYNVDQITQITPNVIQDHQCLLPAVLERLSLVRTTGGPPLQTWVRSDRPPTPETTATQVLRAGTRAHGAAPDDPSDTVSTPSATAPLPRRPN